MTAAMTAKPVRRVPKWTAATVRWWAKLGHMDGCKCKHDPGQVTVYVGGVRHRAIDECWHQAVARINELTPTETVHATRAMYAFRDRLNRPV